MRWLVLAIVFVSAFVSADEVKIKKTILGINPSIRIDSIKPVGGTPFFEVVLETGERLYTSETGSHFVAGDLYQVGLGGVTNLTDKVRRTDRQALLLQLDDSKLIVFAPEGEVKHQLLIFTDIDCGYCRRLHDEIDQLLDHGVEIRYAAFPRAGLGSDSYDKYVSVYCAQDPNSMMTLAKSGETPETATCDNPVADQYDLGQQLGISGTPTLIFENGDMQPGYMPWQELLKRMNQLGS